MNTSPITVLEVTEFAIKIFQATRAHGQPVLMHCDLREIPQASDEELAKVLADFLASSKIKPVNVCGIIPRQFVILRHLSLPSKQKTEIEKMIALQLPKLIPYPKEDMIIDHLVLNQDMTGYSRVLVIAVHRDVVERYLKIFRGAGLTVERLSLSSWCLLQWLVAHDEKMKVRQTGPVMLVNIDTAASEICFCQDGKLLFSRNINYGARDLHEESIAVFAEQIALTMSTYAREKISAEASRIVLVSSLQATELLRDKLLAEQKVPVVAVDPIENMAQKKDLQLPRDLKGASFAVEIGAALDTSKQVFNLMPREESDRRNILEKRQEWLKCSLLFVFVILAGLSVFAVKAYQNSSYLAQVQNNVKELQGKVDTVNDKIKRLEFIKDRLAPRAMTVDIIRELYHLTPPQISFTVLHLDENAGLTVQGVSEEGTAVNIFQKNLVGSTYLKDVTLQYATKRKIFKGELTDFKITCKLSDQGSRP